MGSPGKSHTWTGHERQPMSSQRKSRWKGEGRALSFALCQAIKAVLATDESRPFWSQRAQERIQQLREDHAWLNVEGTVVLQNAEGQVSWWTFAGLRANASLARMLSQNLLCRAIPDSFALTLDDAVPLSRVGRAILHLRQHDVAGFTPNVDAKALQGLKFADCLPEELAFATLQARLKDEIGVVSIE